MDSEEWLQIVQRRTVVGGAANRFPPIRIPLFPRPRMNVVEVVVTRVKDHPVVLYQNHFQDLLILSGG